MAKRVAEEQLTREGLLERDASSRNDRNENDDDIDSDNNNIDSTESGEGTVKLASSEVMRKRKIAIPKRRLGMGFGSGLTSSNAFSSISTPASSTSASISTSTVSAFKSIVPSNNPVNSGFNSDSDRNARLKALNLQFKDKINEAVSKDPFCDLTSMIFKYQEYIKSINTTLTSTSTSTSASKVAPETNISKKPVSIAEQNTVSSKGKDSEDADEEDESSGNKEIKVEGPKFTISTNPIKSDSVFKFGQKDKKSEDDSDNETEIKGPSFKFTGTVKSDVFKFKTAPKADSKVDTDKPKTSNIFGSNLSSNKTPFTTSTAPSTTPTESRTETTAAKPTFTFNFKPPTSVTAAADDDNKKAKEKEENREKEEKAPKFIFGQQAKDSTKTEPSAGLSSSGVNSNSAKPGNSSPFSFSFAPASHKTDTKSEADKTGNGQSKPMFSFGSVANRVAPAFNFGKPKGSDTTTTTTTTTKGSSVFGSTSGLPETPSGGFKFSLPFEQKITLPVSGNTSAFSTRSNTPLTTSAPAPETTDKNITSTENNTEGDTSQTEQSKPMLLQNGEEDEDLLFSQKAKLMVYNTETKSYTTRGVGEMKVLRKKDDKSKVRLLCRSEGMGNILLNTKIVKSFEYKPLTPDKENLVKTPFVEPDGKLTTLIVKFKLKSDGQDYVKAIEDAKQGL